MKKIIITLFFIIDILSIAHADDIISSAVVTTGIVNLGENASIQFNVNQVKVCDSYTVETTVDYFIKNIEIKVNYNYISSCAESSSSTTEIVNKQILLEGIYNVEIKLDVPNNFSWDETIYLTTITVTKPINQSCSGSYIPYFTGICPFVTNRVCACDGQNYENECEAYLQNRNGIYNTQLCSTIIEQSAFPFECKKFQIPENNNFSIYSCSDEEFEGKELYLEYTHEKNDSLIIYFKAGDKSTRLFLTKLENDNIECIAISDKTKLEYADLPAGIYYIIADSKNNYLYDIEFCIQNSISNNIPDTNLVIYPNPIRNFIGIKSGEKIKRINIFDILGVEIYSNVFNISEIVINNIFHPGIYIIEVETDSGIQTKKLVIN